MDTFLSPSENFYKKCTELRVKSQDRNMANNKFS